MLNIPLTIRILLVSLSLAVFGVVVFLIPDKEPLGAPVRINTLEDLQNVQDDYFTTHGKYLQILPGNVLPSDEGGSVKGKLGDDLPAGFSVSTYGSPTGDGYEITVETDTHIFQYGYGPESAERTFVIDKATRVDNI